MGDVLIQPFLAGLSTGLFCCAFCLPFVAPVLVAEERSWREVWLVLGLLILGRFVGYALFGAAAGALSEKLESKTLDILLHGALIILSFLLMLYGIGWLRPQASWCGGLIHHKWRTPFLMGLLMGINLCPPFLLSVIYVFTLHSAVKGMIYFVMFFLGTTLYFLPLAGLKWFSNQPDFRMAARISAVLVGLIFGGYGLYSFFWGGGAVHQP
jgi:sulfite exporter TauE/SafE